MHQYPYCHDDDQNDTITQSNYMLLDPEENTMDTYNDEQDLYATGYNTRSIADQRQERTRWDPKSHRVMKPTKPVKRNITFADDEEYIQPAKRHQNEQAVNTSVQAGPSNTQLPTPIQTTQQSVPIQPAAQVQLTIQTTRTTYHSANNIVKTHHP